MRRALVALVVGALLVVPLAGARGTPAGAGALRVQGRWLVDEDGRVVLLHGVNNVDKSPPYMTPGDGFTLTPADADLLVQHGFNTVRLGVEFDGMMPARGQIDRAYIDRIAEEVDVLGAAGIHVLLDHHQDGLSPKWGGNGFPAWSIHAKPFPAEPNPGFPLYYLMPSMNLGWDEVWHNTHGVVDYLGDALAALARRVRDKPAVLGIELMNEPWPGTATPTCFPLGCPLFDRLFQATWHRLTARIRAVAPGMTVFWEPNVTWNETMPTHIGQPPLTPPITDPSIVFSFHDYCVFSQAVYLGLPETLVELCRLHQGKTWSNYHAFASRVTMPAMVTEFGDSTNAIVLAGTLDRADARLLGWHYWHYTSGEDTFSGARGKQLVRTYPQATAGVPQSLSYNAATGAFRYVYAPRSLGVPTEIYVSDLQYAHGYRVRVTGGHATSAPDAPIVTVVADGGAPVTVTITAV